MIDLRIVFGALLEAHLVVCCCDLSSAYSLIPLVFLHRPTWYSRLWLLQINQLFQIHIHGQLVTWYEYIAYLANEMLAIKFGYNWSLLYTVS